MSDHETIVQYIKIGLGITCLVWFSFWIIRIAHFAELIATK